MDTLFSGGCMCGAVRYESKKEPFETLICHCTDCQKWTGSAYATFSFFALREMKISGVLKEFDVETDSGNVMTKTFCPSCGTHITEISTWSPEYISITVGSLDDPSIVKPSAHCWSKRMLPWVEHIAGLHKFEANPPME